MRCLSCHKLSLRVICGNCHKSLFTPTVTQRRAGKVNVISLFKYKNIESFILTKHTPIGYRVYRYFAKKHIYNFLLNFSKGIERDIYLIGVDEVVNGGYSHISVLAHYSQNRNIIHLPSVLKARSRVKYAGKSLKFRLDNPRDFKYTGKSDIEAILIDDIITSGTTISEAYEVLQKAGVDVLFAVTLADARD